MDVLPSAAAQHFALSSLLIILKTTQGRCNKEPRHGKGTGQGNSSAFSSNPKFMMQVEYNERSDKDKDCQDRCK